MKKPNLRECIIPDPGYVLCEADLKQADAQVVAWEANDTSLKDFFIQQRTDPSLNLHKLNQAILGCSYLMAKKGVHLTNYGGSEYTLAKKLKVSKSFARLFRFKWFSEHPGIKQWHEAILEKLLTTKTIHNKFGYHRIYYDRPDSVLPEALAWIPQSTVALIIDKGLIRLDRELYPVVIPLMQVHDSLVFQIKKSDITSSLLAHIKDCLTVTVPYDDPLIIPVELSTSEVSWGHCKEALWQL